jgi:hypothetical protein
MNTLKIHGQSKRLLANTLLAAGLLAASTSASAVVTFDQTITAIFGNGNADTNWTADLTAGVELGLRAKQRHPAANVFNSGGDGTYTHALGTPPAGQVSWNFEWSIDVTAATIQLDDLTYRIDIDYDPGIGTNFQSFDPIIQAFADHSIGTSATANGAGVEATSAANYISLISANSKAQNSWNLGFFDDGTHALPLGDGQFSFVLSAFDSGGGLVASTSMEVIAGAGAPVPEPETLALLALGLAGVGLTRRKRTTT